MSKLTFLAVALFLGIASANLCVRRFNNGETFARMRWENGILYFGDDNVPTAYSDLGTAEAIRQQYNISEDSCPDVFNSIEYRDPGLVLTPQCGGTETPISGDENLNNYVQSNSVTPTVNNIYLVRFNEPNNVATLRVRVLEINPNDALIEWKPIAGDDASFTCPPEAGQAVVTTGAVAQEEREVASEWVEGATIALFVLFGALAALIAALYAVTVGRRNRGVTAVPVDRREIVA